MVERNGSADLKGKACVVTGAGGKGIGFETARELSSRGCHTVLACRGAKCSAAATRIRRGDAGANVEAVQLDISDVRSVDSFAHRLALRFREGVHVLINNAAVADWNVGKGHVNQYGFESTLFTNAVGPFMVTNALMPLLTRAAWKSGEPSRVVTVASSAHRLGRLVSAVA